MAKPHSIKFQINREFLTRIFSKIKVSTTNFYNGVPCWEWQGAKYKEGYAQLAHNRPVSFGRKINLYVHRLIYEHFVAPVAPELVCDHLCRVRHCINPCHIEPVTNKVNVLRGEGACAKYAKQTHCKHGHELSGDNLKFSTNRTTGRKERRCKICSQIRQEKFHGKIKKLPYDHPERAKYRNFPCRVKRNEARRKMSKS